MKNIKNLKWHHIAIIIIVSIILLGELAYLIGKYLF